MTLPSHVTSVQELGFEATAEVMGAGFADYLVTMKVTAEGMRRLARTDQVDFDCSRVIWAEGTPVGVALIARRGDVCRVAGMCLIPAARGQGLGRALLNTVMAEAQARGDRAMVLEVIDQNVAAKQLYRQAGFRPLRQLRGFRAEPIPPPPHPSSVPACSLDTFIARARAQEPPDLPWQISSPTLATVDPVHYTAHLAGELAVLVGHRQDNTKVIRGLVAPPDPADPAHDAALRQLRGQWPGSSWEAAPLFPEAWAPLFLGAGFSPAKLAQTQLGRSLVSED